MTQIHFSVTRKPQPGEHWWVGGRNGTAQCGGIAAWTFEYPGSPLTVHLDLLSSKHQAIAGGGGSFPPELLDEFCRQWLAARQEVKQYEKYSNCPKCGAPVEGGSVAVGPNAETTQEVWCTACDWRGTDRYLFLGYEDSE